MTPAWRPERSNRWISPWPSGWDRAAAASVDPFGDQAIVPQANDRSMTRPGSSGGLGAEVADGADGAAEDAAGRSAEETGVIPDGAAGVALPVPQAAAARATSPRTVAQRARRPDLRIIPR